MGGNILIFACELKWVELFRQHPRSGYTALGPICPMPDGGKTRFDHIGRADTHPVLCRKVVERQQRIPVLPQTFNGLRVFRAEALFNTIESVFRVLPTLRPLPTNALLCTTMPNGMPQIPRTGFVCIRT